MNQEPKRGKLVKSIKLPEMTVSQFAEKQKEIQQISQQAQAEIAKRQNYLEGGINHALAANDLNATDYEVFLSQDGKAIEVYAKIAEKEKSKKGNLKAVEK